MILEKGVHDPKYILCQWLVVVVDGLRQAKARPKDAILLLL